MLRQVLQAFQPLLSQLPFIELGVNLCQIGPVAAVADTLGATTTKLRLRFMISDPNRGGNMTTPTGWLELLDALPLVSTVQVTFENNSVGSAGRVQTHFPLYREGLVLSEVRPAVERVLTSAISGCEKKGR
jgi:hypothetical protein